MTDDVQADAPEAVEQTHEPSLDDLLSEYEQQTAPREEAPRQQAPQVPPDYEYIQQMARDYEAQQTKSAIQETVTGIKNLGENLKDVDNEIIEGMLQSRAARDPRIATAWAMRHQKPSEWNKVAKSLAKELDSKFHFPDRQATEDREALRAAVKSGPVQTNEVSIKDLNGMSDSEFAAFKASL